MEDIRFDPASGQMLTGSFMDHGMPRASDLSAIHCDSNAVPTQTNPLGVTRALARPAMPARNATFHFDRTAEEAVQFFRPDMGQFAWAEELHSNLTNLFFAYRVERFVLRLVADGVVDDPGFDDGI